jgi:hypothetical protein
VQSKGLVRTAKESKQARDTHILLSAKQETGQDRERKLQVKDTHKVLSTKQGTGQDNKRK